MVRLTRIAQDMLLNVEELVFLPADANASVLFPVATGPRLFRKTVVHRRSGLQYGLSSLATCSRGIPQFSRTWIGRVQGKSPVKASIQI